MTAQDARARLLEMADEAERAAFRLQQRCGRVEPPRVHRDCGSRKSGLYYGTCRLAEARRARAAELKEIADAIRV